MSVVGCCFFQAEDGIRDLVRSRGLGDVYKRQVSTTGAWVVVPSSLVSWSLVLGPQLVKIRALLILSLIHI